MYEKQTSIKDITAFKNKIKEVLPAGYSVNYNNSEITVSTPKGKTIFNGKIGSNPIGCVISGEFKAEKFVRRLAMVIVIIYLAVLLFTFSMGQHFYDYQVFMMIVGVAALAIIKRYTDSRAEVIKKALEEL